MQHGYTLTMNDAADNPLAHRKRHSRRRSLSQTAEGLDPPRLALPFPACFNGVVSAFDYRAPAELYASASKTGKRPMRYTRFRSAAEAIKYAVEELPPELLIGSTLEVNEERFDGFGIRALYDSASYPLRRRKTG